MKVLVGLGNPGSKYEDNRHNVGFMAIDAIAERYGVVQWRKRFHGAAAEVDIDRVRYLLLKPATYMNESGRAVSEATRFYKMSPADVIVFHDELDLEPGKVRAKFGGGHAGHNGLKSITAHIGNDYQRVRIGIGHPGHRDLVSNYVLNDFAKSDGDWLFPLLDAIARAVPNLVIGDDPKFLNEVARLTRPAPATRKADRASASQPAAAVNPEPAPANIDTPAEPAAPPPVAEQPKPVVTPAEPAPQSPVAEQPMPEPEPAKADLAPEPAAPPPVAEQPKPVATPAEPAAPPPAVAEQPKPVATTAEPAPQSAATAEPIPDPAPAPRDMELEPAMAEADTAKQEVPGGLASKFKKWFGRG